MKAKSIYKDKRQAAAVVVYRFTEDTDPKTKSDFEAMLRDLAFAEEEGVSSEIRTPSAEYLPDVKKIRTDIKTFVKHNVDKVGAGSRVIVYYSKNDTPAVKMRVYTFD